MNSGIHPCPRPHVARPNHKESVRFSEAEREYLDLANPGEIAELANHLDY